MLVAALFLAPAAQAQSPRIIPVPPEVTPRWTPWPGSPQVYYAPNLPTDVFRYQGRYYFLWEGIWYMSKSVKGPWRRVRPPEALERLDRSTFKTAGGPGGPSRTGGGAGRAQGPGGLSLPEGYQGPSVGDFTAPPTDVGDRFKPPASFKPPQTGAAPALPPGQAGRPSPYHPLPGQDQTPVAEPIPMPPEPPPVSDPRVPKAM
jgi:hypothetical protein